MQDDPEDRARGESRPVFPEKVYEIFILKWKGRALTLRWCPQWSEDITAHLEIVTEDRRPHPISETGYRSHFIARQRVEEAGGPVAYVTLWLESKDDGIPVQLSLF